MPFTTLSPTAAAAAGATVEQLVPDLGRIPHENYPAMLLAGATGAGARARTEITNPNCRAYEKDFWYATTYFKYWWRYRTGI